MTDREKLIALQQEATKICGNRNCVVCVYRPKGFNCKYELIADHLVANGVVVREKGVAAAVMKRLLDGEWVETQEVEAALGIDFSEGMKLFDFGRTAEWNPAPLNGQKITTMFRLKRGEDDG